MEEMNNTMMSNEVEETEVTTDMVPSEPETVVTSEDSTESNESSGMAGAAIFLGVCALAGYGAYTIGKKVVGKVAPAVKDKLSKFKKPKEEGEPSEPVDIEVEASEVEPEEDKK